MTKKISGFTLAEVLITLGIIGAVAAMTLPVLTKSIDNRTNMTALKKFYAEFSNATNLIMVENEEPAYWDLKDNDNASSERVINFYKTHLSTIKTCKNGDSSCFPFPVYSSAGTVKITASNYNSWKMQSFVLKNGTAVCFDVNNGWFSVFFDVNGFKNPNQLGEDVFAWAVNKQGRIVDMYDSSINNSTGQDKDYNYAFEYMKNGWRKP